MGRIFKRAPRLDGDQQEWWKAFGTLLHLVAGVVRAISSIKSECSAREIQIFWPLIT